jgi:hypothetical protein
MNQLDQLGSLGKAFLVHTAVFNRGCGSRMELGKRTFEEIRLLYDSSVVIASLETLLALRTAVLRAEVAGRGWN